MKQTYNPKIDPTLAQYTTGEFSEQWESDRTLNKNFGLLDIQMKKW